MLTTGSKFLIGSAVLATISAIAYGITQDGVMGTVGLASAAIALMFLAGVNIFTRDSNVWADEISTVESAPAARPAPGDGIWPLAFALSAVIITIGLVTYPPVFTVGIVLLLATGAEWTAHAWSERASADSVHNAAVRSRIANPLEFPIGAAIGIGILVYTFSRIMLWLSKTNTVIAFSVLGAIIILLGFLFAYRPGAKSRAAVGVIAIAAVGLVAGGAVAGVDGQRTIHPHETVNALAAEGTDICQSPEVSEADVNASQNVGAVASVAAFVTLDKNGALSLEVDGPALSPELTLARSNPSNVVFVNNSGTERRLSVSLGTEAAETGDETVPVYKCTTLVDHGGRQNMTLRIGVPSFAYPDGYYFFVPGVDSARMELVVP